MAATHLIKARVSLETKQRVQALAEQQLLNESVWLRRVVAAALGDPSTGEPRRPSNSSARDVDVLADSPDRLTGRVCLRLRREDQLLLRERSAARGLASATYVSVLVRAHLRHLTPLPREEIKALKHSVAELSAIGRNLNQLARAANQGQRITVSNSSLMGILRAFEALLKHTKGLIRANEESWEVGHARVQD
ncbi:hypothetical protein HNQ60_004520 [Povalibacter uvarum]|uniref:Plasmid mobilization relaxosome protein MobC n=1 Tax=Povalibacter uvarum TaxID=732238 RepID=A0A841HTK5_9GAMM|nr:plasmid mobilization relaxosome protein MobC [Povalibacter uvarum]MBB6095629.1 hypothetical protein [Povalibacter uvarum]